MTVVAAKSTGGGKADDDADILCDAIFLASASTPPVATVAVEARAQRLTKALLLMAYHVTRAEENDEDSPPLVVPTFLDSDEARLETTLLELFRTLASRLA